ncbi:MAG TPA: hypothetical protein VL551_24185 [Actinospica sp.]|jgi:3-hydroxyacyl-[acyl-carrier-protein] dehydratase|nr:hypothetical protein [Actinospica sp.]
MTETALGAVRPRTPEPVRHPTPAEATPLADDVRVVSFDRSAPSTITTAAYVDPAAPLLAGHYPGFPIFPGVCLIECAHRSVLSAGRLLGLSPALDGVRSARFSSPVLPGDEVTTEVELTTTAGRWQAKANATVGGRRVATVRLEYALPGPDAESDDRAPAAAAAPLETDAADADAGPAQIALRLPHRHPMLLVDRVLALTPGRAVRAVKAVTASEPWFRPRRPSEVVDDRLPASLLIESWCQAACLLAAWDEPTPDVLAGQVLLFGSLADVQLPAAARTGDVVEHRARLVRSDGGVFVFEGTAAVAGRPVLRVGQALVALRPAAALRAAG